MTCTDGFSSHRSIGATFAVSLLFFVAATVALTLHVGSASAASLYEPNDNYLQAHGPMIGGKNYDIVIDTNNDEDWFYFYTAGQSQMSLKISYLSGDCYDSDNLMLYRDDASTEVVELDIWQPTRLVDEYIFTVPGAKKFFMKAVGDITCSFRITLTPASALTTIVPPDALAIQSCISASASSNKYAKRVSATKRKLRKKSIRGKSRRILRAKLRKYKALSRQANARRAVSCTPAVLELIQNDPALSSS